MVGDLKSFVGYGQITCQNWRRKDKENKNNALRL